MTAAELLHRAAEKLKLYASGATPGPWDRAGYHEVAAGQYPDNAIGNWSGAYARCVSHSGTGIGEDADRDARYIALMHPPVALALADLLDAQVPLFAGLAAWPADDHEVIRLARAILREDS